jgi:hypothetical protein
MLLNRAGATHPFGGINPAVVLSSLFHWMPLARAGGLFFCSFITSKIKNAPLHKKYGMQPVYIGCKTGIRKTGHT